MKAEGFDRADQARQCAAAPEPAAAAGLERLLEREQVRTQALGVRVRFAAHRGQPWRIATGQCLVGRRQSRIAAGDRSTVRLVASRRIVVAALLGKDVHRFADRGQLVGDRQFRAQRVQALQIIGQHRLRGTAERQLQRLGGNVRIAVAVAADPAAESQEALRAVLENPLPARVQRRQHRHEDVAHVRQRGVHLVGHVQAFAPQRARLPQQRNLPRDRMLDEFTFRGLGAAGLAHAHHRRDAVAMIEHALAHHLGGVRGQHRHDQRAIEQRNRLMHIDADRRQALQRATQVAALFGVAALQILGQIRQHREQHEAAHECNRLIEAERIEARLDAAPGVHATIAVDRSGADVFDAPEQRLTAVFANHVAEQLAEKADVRVLGDHQGRLRACDFDFCHVDELRPGLPRVSDRY